ncbi:M15 family metallopeptidase [Pseudokineococcus basanitobsidens]|uniref:M15 family metallopeptidase n=1 Tax=Pseudokineococcus basanitobsidens TaxID=1926649 RepID=A0ABU8RF61_9ACTN
MRTRTPRTPRALGGLVAVLVGATLLAPTSAAAAPAGAGTARATDTVALSALPAYRTSVRGVTRDELGASWHPGCPVAPADLRQITVRYVGGNGRAYDGVVVMHKKYVGVTQRVFQRLYAARFPVERVVPVSQYGGDDEASMRANNTSGFNCRPGRHDDGAAIDINPLVNPYVKGTVVQPSTARRYVDRSQSVRGMITPGDVVVRAFAAEGWRWGGSWKTLKDYQHFSDDGR